MPIDGFLKIDGIDGECKDADHPKWIDVTGFEWGMTQETVPGPDGTFSACTPTVQSVQFSQPLSRASPLLFDACVTGRQIAAMTFEGRLNYGGDHFTFMQAEFKDCLVASIDTSSAGAGVTEEVEIVFRSVDVRTKERPI